MAYEGSRGYGSGEFGSSGGHGHSGRGGRGSGRPSLLKPVKEGDEATITIEAVGSKGDGIGKIKGFVVFVPGVHTGETIKVRIKEVRGKSAVGEKIE